MIKLADNIKLIDSHCHLQYPPLVDKLPDLINNINDKLSKLICVATSIPCTPAINNIIKSYNTHKESCRIYSTVGVHPLHLEDYMQKSYAIEQDLINNLNIAHNVIAIGESGLDDFRRPLDKMQIQACEAHIRVSIKYNLPIVIHARSGDNSVVEYELMQLFNKYPDVKIIAHCYGGSEAFMKYLVQRGSLISFACNIGYKNAHNLRNTASMVPISNIMIETDSPFLSPQNKRGTPNDPTNVYCVAHILSEIYDMDIDKFANQIHQNFDSFFSNVLNKVD